MEEENDPEILENMKLDLLDMDVVINNVCASFNIGLKTGVSLNLENLVMRGVNMEYKTQNKVTVGLRKPRCGAYVYTSGKISVFGNKSEEDAKFAARKPVLQRSFEDLRSSKIFRRRSIFVFGPFQIVEESLKLRRF